MSKKTACLDTTQVSDWDPSFTQSFDWRWIAQSVWKYSKIHCCCQAVVTQSAKHALRCWLLRAIFFAAQNAVSYISYAVVLRACQRMLPYSAQLMKGDSLLLLEGVTEVPAVSCVKPILMMQYLCTVGHVRRLSVLNVILPTQFEKVTRCTLVTRLTHLRICSAKKGWVCLSISWE
jgi:hypothetical protein